MDTTDNITNTCYKHKYSSYFTCNFTTCSSCGYTQLHMITYGHVETTFIYNYVQSFFLPGSTHFRSTTERSHADNLKNRVGHASYSRASFSSDLQRKLIPLYLPYCLQLFESILRPETSSLFLSLLAASCEDNRARLARDFRTR